MKTLIVYCSSHGTTEKAAVMLSELLEGENKLVNLKEVREIEVEEYDAVIIGGSIHAGMIQMKVRKFMKKNEDVLKIKNLGLFLCCMNKDKKAEEQFNLAFPEGLRNHSTVNSLFGGEFLVSKMNIVERKIVRKVSGITKNTSAFDQHAVLQFAETFNHRIPV